MSRESLRRRANAVRDLPLEIVFTQWGATPDRHDKRKWHTEQGPISITGAKFHNWRCGVGGGGAIDLVMHLEGTDCTTAVQWLERHVATTAVASQVGLTTPSGASSRSRSASRTSSPPLQLPRRDDRLLNRVCRYLTNRRHLSPELIQPLIESGKLYADGRSNAVFLLVAGKAQQPVGAELRGTGGRVWRGMAPGTCKDLGYFWVGSGSATHAPSATQIVLCESAIDAISYSQLHRDCICVSTSGVRANPLWLRKLIDRGYQITCGFDADEAGDAAARHMMALYPTIQRLRPCVHDWNDVLAACHQA